MSSEAKRTGEPGSREGAPRGYNVGSERLARTERLIAEIDAANATRRPCPECGVAILPANLERHVALHGDD